MPQNKLQAAAELITAAYTDGKQIDSSTVTHLLPMGKTEAYQIQDLVSELLTDSKESQNVWKTGANTLEEIPFAAPIPSPFVHKTGAQLDSSKFHMIGVESELVFEFGQDMPDIGRDYTESEVMAAIAKVRVAVEIIDTRFKDWSNTEDSWLLSDNSMSGGIILGDGTTDVRSINYAQQVAQIMINGELHTQKKGGLPTVDPTHLVVWICNHRSKRDGGFKKGQMVTTGTHVGMPEVTKGATVEARFPGIGSAYVEFK
ncbi:hypothetical protein TW84_02895 [Vibrio neptunius]|uniref:2-keto-4-pentenoate hydratase n=1 Tax=Vibrio neptunius TaxID=170651 RepID=UPI0005FA40DB|nr:hypothetical protein [Vibrio neptunius]KJY93574.1 hypothetical protein TW84_02895 [Vibrio neptunius]